MIPLVCPPDWAQGGKTLHDLDWGRRDHVSVLKVRRGQTHWNIPEGNVALAGGDQLVVMGSQRQVENFCLQPAGELMTLKDYIASQQDIPEAKQLLCCGVSLDKTMPQAGKSVRDSGIKGDWSALLIGLERDLLPIPSPDPSLTLRDGDLLWVMGSQEQAAAPGPAGLKKRPKIGTPPSRYESTDWGVSFCAQFFGGKVYADVPLWTGFPPG